MASIEEDTADQAQRVSTPEVAERGPSRVRALASPEASAFIRERGGRLYVWATRLMCCGASVKTVHTSTEAPSRLSNFRELDAGEFSLFVDPSIGDPPAQIEVTLRGRWHQRIRTSWDGPI